MDKLHYLEKRLGEAAFAVSVTVMAGAFLALLIGPGQGSAKLKLAVIVGAALSLLVSAVYRANLDFKGRHHE